MVDLRAAPTTPLTVSAGQAGCIPRDVTANVATAAALVRLAAGEGADLLVLPELFLSGYELEAIVAEPATYALAPDDGRLDPLRRACRDTATAVVAGAPGHDAEAGRVCISALVLGRDGGFVARYDKQHLDSTERAAGFRPGTRGCTLVLDGWRLGLGICWDSSFPEHGRAAALDGCHAYLIGALFDRGPGERKRALLGAARALDNATYVVLANHCGPSGPYDGCGRSSVWDPGGVLVDDAYGDDPGVATATLDPAVLARARGGDLPLADPSLAAGTGARSTATIA
jgi:5-aminopentanamidase